MVKLFFFAGKNGAFSKESLLLVNTPFSFNRAADVIDALKSRVPDPCVTCQWGVVGSETNTLATLHVTSPDVGDMGRLVYFLLAFFYAIVFRSIFEVVQGHGMNLSSNSLIQNTF